MTFVSFFLEAEDFFGDGFFVGFITAEGKNRGTVPDRGAPSVRLSGD